MIFKLYLSVLNMIYRKINLFLVSVLAIVLFYNIPVYNTWLNDKILADNVNVFEQIKHLNLDDRNAARFGNYYTYKAIKGKFGVLKNPIIFLPPANYLKALQVSFTPPEPAVFYYFTGLHSVCLGSANIADAQWAFSFKEKDRMGVVKIRDKNDLDSLVRLYQKYN